MGKAKNDNTNDNEIVVNVIKKTPTKNKNKKKKQTRKKQTTKTKTVKKNTQKKENNNKVTVVKWITICILILIAMIFIMLSSIFNIKKIDVTNNAKVTTTEIINNAQISIGQNIFKINKSNIKQNIKTNPYIEEVTIKRDIINMTLKIEVKEREVSYIIQYANAYVYIDNQGYILEISSEGKEKPILIGTTTKIEDLEVGQRLEKNDLYKLNGTLKIMETAKNYDIEDKITSIDISDDKEYTINMLEGEKIVYFGVASNINEKVILIKKMLETEEGKCGEFFINKMDESNDVYFREKV